MRVRQTRKLRSLRRGLQSALKEIDLSSRAQTRAVLRAGKVLIAIKAEVRHGNWLAWVEKNFRLSQRTARNYIAAAEWFGTCGLKSATVANLAPTLMYELARVDADSVEFPPRIQKRIFEEAQQRPIDLREAREISDQIRGVHAQNDAAAQPGAPAGASGGDDEDHHDRPERADCGSEQGEHADGVDVVAAAEKARQEEADRERAEAEAILDGPPPEVPPPEEYVSPLLVPDHHDAAVLDELNDFNALREAVHEILRHETKPSANYVSLQCTNDELSRASAVLTAWRDAKKIAAEQKAT